MQLEVLRNLFMRALKLPPGMNRKLDYNHCLDQVLNLVRRELPKELDSNERLKLEDQQRLLCVAWDLILQRVIVPGHGDPGTTPDGWPYLTITEFGKDVINSGSGPTAYDPDGYLASLPRISDTVRIYLAESLSSFRTENQLAAAVTLGAASEMLFIELCEAFKPALADVNEQTGFEKDSKKQKIKHRIEAVINWLKRKRTQLPDKWKTDEQIDLIDRTAELIRLWRNDAGHPNDPPYRRSHQEIYALLQLFKHYCAEICSLKQWLQTSTGKIV